MGRYDPKNESSYREGILDDISSIIDSFEVSKVKHDELANNLMDNYYSKGIIEKLEIEKRKYSSEYFKSVVTDFINPLIKINLETIRLLQKN